ncbi:SWIM zinc finger family protein, partial [Candidatus Riflebacteria bacterium]
MAKKRENAKKQMLKLRKKGMEIQPVELEGRTIARTFWGKAWCRHLEKFSDYENRLPRGRTYVRNGSVCHLEVNKGLIKAMVSGTEIYNVRLKITNLTRKKWMQIKKNCAGKVGTLIELLQGRLSDEIMAVVTHTKNGLFPLPGEMDLFCSCPDWAEMCKHVAAALYGVSTRLDEIPELVFSLRGVDHNELIATSAEKAVKTVVAGRVKGKSRRLVVEDLTGVFGIEIDRVGSEKKKRVRLSDKAEKKEATKNRKPGKVKQKTTVKRPLIKAIKAPLIMG